jgi:IS4 transposase
VKVSPQARKRNPALPPLWGVRKVSYEVQGRMKTVKTSLAAKTYNTKAVASLYRERWEIDLGFRDIKSTVQ